MIIFKTSYHCSYWMDSIEWWGIWFLMSSTFDSLKMWCTGWDGGWKFSSDLCRNNCFWKGQLSNDHFQNIVFVGQLNQFSRMRAHWICLEWVFWFIEKTWVESEIWQRSNLFWNTLHITNICSKDVCRWSQKKKSVV